MSSAVKKVCTICGLDVANTERIKDEVGRYYCQDCWKTHRKQAASDAAAPDSATSASRGKGALRFERLIVSVGAVAIILLLAIGSYFLYFRDRWERGNRDALLALVSQVEANLTKKAFREAQPLLDLIDGTVQDHTIRDAELQDQVRRALARRSEVMAGIAKLDQERDREQRAAETARIAKAQQQKALADQQAAEERRLRAEQEQSRQRRELIKTQPETSYKQFAAAFIATAAKSVTETSRVAYIDAKYSISLPRTNDALTPMLGVLEASIISRVAGKQSDTGTPMRFTFAPGADNWELLSIDTKLIAVVNGPFGREVHATNWMSDVLNLHDGFWIDVMKRTTTEMSSNP